MTEKIDPTNPVELLASVSDVHAKVRGLRDFTKKIYLEMKILELRSEGKTWGAEDATRWNDEFESELGRFYSDRRIEILAEIEDFDPALAAKVDLRNGKPI